MAANIIKNNYIYPKTKLNYSRSSEYYLRCHTTNLLTGYITPVGYLDCMPGDTIPNDFGFVLQSAPLLGPSLDNIYIDFIAVWCPTRLVMQEFNQWMGDNDSLAWTIPANVNYPKITKVRTGKNSSNAKWSKAYVAEHFVGPHLGFRFYDTTENGTGTDFTTEPTNSVYHDGINVIPSRMYLLNYNRIFRNENVTNPILFSKQTGTDLSLDVARFTNNLGELQRANRLKNNFNTARRSPVIQSVDIGLGTDLPVITGSNEHGSSYGLQWIDPATGTTPVVSSGEFHINSSGTTRLFSSGGGTDYNVSAAPSNLYADLSQLTVNSLYYAQMLQRYYYKASNGRRPVEFYFNQFGIENSQAAEDDPQLIAHKRFKVNISRVIATGNSTDVQSNTQPLGSQGAFSITSDGGKLYPEFTCTEYGMVQIYAVIRTQESFSSGIDKYLSHGDLLSTFLPVFDHIGDQAIEIREFSNARGLLNSNYIFGYQQAWYDYRKPTSDVVGICSPGEPLGYFSLGRDFPWGVGAFTVNDDFIQQSCLEFDRMLQFPVCYNPSGATTDIDGEPLDSNRYQWILQFALSGNWTRTMSKNSIPLTYK